ncbi:MAG: hypothetical protein ACW98X_21475 [Promethearchaeota archaeon]|jgi:hypothetical protein
MKQGNRVFNKSNPEKMIIRRQEFAIGNRYIDKNNNDRIMNSQRINQSIIRVKRG